MNILSSQNLKCSKHPNKYIIFMQVNQLDDTKHLLYCDLCILYDQNFKSLDYVYIQQIIEYSNNSHIVNWPPIDDQILKNQIIQLQTEYKKQSKLECQITKYFENLKAEISTKINLCQKNMILKAQDSPLYEDQILKILQETQKIDQFKSILLNCNDDIDDKEKQCREFIKQVNQQKSSYTEQFKQKFDKLNQNQQQIDFETPNLMKNSILSLIENINFFISDNHLNIEQVNNKQKYSYQQKDISNKCKVEKLIDLISVKSNYLTNEFIDSIKQLFIQISPLIDQISFDQVHLNNNNLIDFSKLSDMQMDIIRDMAEYYTQLQKNQNLISQVKKSNQFQKISSILNNKTNYLQNKFIEEFEKYIIDSYPLLNSVNFNNSLKEHQQIHTFIHIKDEDLQDICELYQKKKELEQNNCLQNNTQSFKVNQQISSLYKQYKKQNLDSLLQKYPIYDLLQPLKYIDLLPNLQLIKSQYLWQDSQNIEMRKFGNNTISITSKQGNYGSYYSNFILDRNEKYIFRFQFQRNKQFEGFTVGLVRDENLDTNQSYDNKLSCFFYYNNENYNGHTPGHGIDIKKKGDLSETKEINCVELRVCISDELLELVDYPNYNHKYVLSDQYKNNLKTYQNLRLGIYVQQEIEVVLISSIICEQFEI